MRRGFTLIELIVVVAIILILAAILFPVLSRHPEHQGSRSSCQSNLKQIGLGFKQYVQDADDHLPLISAGGQGWAEEIQPYVRSWQIFQCPTGPQHYDAKGPLLSDYFLNERVAGLEMAKFPSKSQTLLLGEGLDNGATNSHFSEMPLDWRNAERSPATWHLDGANYAWLDGHVKWLRPEKVTTLSPLQHPLVVATFAVR